VNNPNLIENVANTISTARYTHRHSRDPYRATALDLQAAGLLADQAEPQQARAAALEQAADDAALFVPPAAAREVAEWLRARAATERAAEPQPEQAAAPPPAALPGDVREFLETVRDALDVPLPDITPEDERAHAALLRRRSSRVHIIVSCILNGHALANSTTQLRGWTQSSPIAYKLWAGHPDTPGRCELCGCRPDSPDYVTASCPCTCHDTPACDPAHRGGAQ
jgi:hypothetical protein